MTSRDPRSFTASASKRVCAGIWVCSCLYSRNPWLLLSLLRSVGDRINKCQGNTLLIYLNLSSFRTLGKLRLRVFVAGVREK